MRSAIYYPHSKVEDEAIVRQALLMWDQLKVIVPDNEHQPCAPEFTDAWNLVGKKLVPSDQQKKLAHENILEFTSEPLPPNFYYDSESDRSGPPYEVYPQKFLHQTWHELQRAGLAGDQLGNADFPFSEAGGLLIMSKLADACAGTTFAQVTDRVASYKLISDQLAKPLQPMETMEETVVSMGLKLVGAENIPLKALVEFRERETLEANGYDYTQLRHRLMDYTGELVKTVREATLDDDVEEKIRGVKLRMDTDLRLLQRELMMADVATLLTSSAVVTAVVSVSGWAAAAATGNPVAALPMMSAAVSIPTAVGAFAASKLRAQKRREVLDKHPMAHLYMLPGARAPHGRRGLNP